MKEIDLETIKSELQKNQSEKRFEHTVSVVDTALKYADAFGLDAKDKSKVELAAWLHDICKEFKSTEMLALAKHYGIEIHAEDKSMPNVLHARVGAALVEDKYEIYDPEILAAIREHTLGAKEMTMISKILYLADFAEPLRDKREKDKNPNQETYCDPIRRSIFDDKDIDKALLEAMDVKISYVIKKKQAVHPLAIEARNAIL